MRVKLQRLTVNVETAGTGHPLLVLPGWTSSAFGCRRSMEPWFNGRDAIQRIYVDLPGHGATPAADWVHGLDEMLAVLLELIDTLLGERRFLLAGESLGAYLARGVLARRPDQIDGLMLTVPLIRPRDDERTVPPHTVIAQDATAVAQLPPEAADLLDYLVVQTGPHLEQILSGFNLPPEMGGDPDFLDAIRTDPDRYTLSFDVDALDAPFDQPALIMCGRQDNVVGYRDAWQLLDIYPRASFAVLDRAGHFMDEQTAVQRTLIHEWLDRVAEQRDQRP